MLIIVIPAIIIITIMLIMAFCIFKNIVSRLDENTKEYFLNKLQDYNYIVEEKKKELDNLKLEIEKLKEEQFTEEELSKEKLPEIKEESEGQALENEEIARIIKVPEYKEDTFFYNYKRLKKDFYFNTEKKITEFISKNEDEEISKTNNELLSFRKLFNDETIYNCLTLNNEEQHKLVKDVLNKKQAKILEFDSNFTEPEKFNVVEFLNYVDEKIEQTDPNVYVYVSKSDINYDYINKNVKTIFYDKMSEGVIIKYKNKVYDYSI